MRATWKIILKPGMKAEYKKRHDEIWPEMTAALNEAGISNYSIWNTGNDLFGYYEADDIGHCNKVLGSSPVVARWNEYMKDVIDFEIDPETGTVPALELMFLYE